MNAEKFWSRTRIEGDCLIWLGAKSSFGYGSLNLGKNHSLGRFVNAHRYAFYITKGDPGSLQVLHTCDNPPCVKPDHLYVGTRKNNMWDRDSRGRNRRAKLTLEQVKEIKSSSDAFVKQLAGRFGVTINQIENILLGRSWGWM